MCLIHFYNFNEMYGGSNLQKSLINNSILYNIYDNNNDNDNNLQLSKINNNNNKKGSNSKLPTLFQIGTLIPRMNENINDIKNKTSIEHILDWFDKRIPETYKGVPKIPIKDMSDRVVILKSGTGSAKSTGFPTELYLKFYKRVKKQIIITQPRVLTAIDIPKEIDKLQHYKIPNKDNLFIELYKNLGYQTKEFIRKPLEKGILFSTVGILLQFLKLLDDDVLINKYGFIIIDEVHERSLDVDLVLYFLKKLVSNNIKKDPPFIILMSATFDEYKFAKYFSTKTIFEVSGKSYPIISNFPKYNINNYLDTTIETIINIHTNNENDFINNKIINYNNNSDIIVFVSGISMINKIIKKLDIINNDLKYHIIPIVLTSSEFKLGGKNYKSLFSNLKLLNININNKLVIPVRRVIIATNIAETGVTLESLKYCIDTGYVTSIEFNPNFNCSMLLNKPITQGMALQRKGRVGRKQEGVWYPLYTEETFNNMIKDQNPSIYTEEFTNNLLSIIINLSTNSNDKSSNFLDTIKKNIIDINDINLLDNPSIDSIDNSLNKLYILGIIDEFNYPTQLGLMINKFRKLNIEISKMILSGFYYDVNVLDLITIGCFLTISKKNIVISKFKSFNNSFDSDIDKCIDYYQFNKLKSKLLISCEFIDFILFFDSFLNIVKKYYNDIDYIKEWCLSKKINYNGIMNVIYLRDEIINTLIFNIGLNPFLNSHKNLYNIISISDSLNNDESIMEISNFKKCIFEGFKLNIASFDYEKKMFITNNSHIPINIDSYLIRNMPILNFGEPFIQQHPQYIIYSSLLLKLNSLTNQYEYYTGDCISIIDGYYNFDNTFNIS